jgi:hypothetical protein
LASSRDAAAAPTLDDYRHFRALSVDLVGRIPTRAEVAAFEAPGFDLDAWIDAHLSGPAYAERLARIYMDLLRLQISPVFNASNNAVGLHRETIVGPDGNPMYVFYRLGQRRARMETDGDFCLTPDETGLQFPQLAPPIVYPAGAPRTTGTPVSQAVLDANTVVVKPWWLYRDYASPTPTQLYDKLTFPTKYGFKIFNGLLVEPDNKTVTTQIRICKEETQATDTGHVYVSGRTTPVQGDGGGPPFGRFTNVPIDDAFTKANPNAVISCRTSTGVAHAADCGCGVGLEHCFPAAGNNPMASPAVQMGALDVLGAAAPVDDLVQSPSDWTRLWWSEEARHFLAYLFSEDRDFREILTAPYTFVNGPLAQYYKSEAPAGCCGQGISFGYVAPDSLLDPNAVPGAILPHDAQTWTKIDARSTHAAGIMTMPIFLTKFGTRRSKAHVLYNAFLCKDFIAPPGLQLPPSTESNLMIRQGCNSCHATLEPMAAYFSRIMESDITYLPPDKFPVDTSATCSGTTTGICSCKTNSSGNLSGACAQYYDPAFSDGKHAVLRGAYPDVRGGSQGHADAGPMGMANELVQNPDFAACVASNFASSFLGRPLGPEDDPLKAQLASTLAGGGFHTRAVVRAMLMSDAYRKANNLTSSAWRKAGGGQ